MIGRPRRGQRDRGGRGAAVPTASEAGAQRRRQRFAHHRARLRSGQREARLLGDPAAVDQEVTIAELFANVPGRAGRSDADYAALARVYVGIVRTGREQASTPGR